MRITAQGSFAATHNPALIYPVCPTAGWVVCFSGKPPISHTGPNRALKKSLLQGKICLGPTDRMKKQNAAGKYPPSRGHSPTLTPIPIQTGLLPVAETAGSPSSIHLLPEGSTP